MRSPESDQQNQQKCKHCGRIVGCNYRGRKHKCDCKRKGRGMKLITKEQLDKLWGYAQTIEQRAILRNGENAYCESKKTIVSCCSNCGDYSRTKIPD